ncbi:LAMI_0B00980g1_1 [Lachancea mirantina]|uniref:LAMI_0B00980g1_1 n=1 Tax=Lachancea mirantina TaxID=1230905 RepID=A0A1G4ITH0_9SACH|nr:LAMI_0B00980g1_1 [Lachancea mirantina]
MAKKRSNVPNGNYSNSTESISSLTKPQLFGIYDADVVNNEDTEIYEEARKSVGKFADGPKQFGKESGSKKMFSMQRLGHIVFSIAFLGVAGISYNELSKQLHDNHALHPEFASRPLALGVEICQKLSFGYVPTWMAYALEGIVFGSLLPLIDVVYGKPVRSSSFTSVLRAVNAMLGVAFGIRKIEWSSSLQASGAWFLLNIVLWMFFDGTLSMLIGCLGIGTVACATSFYDITEYSHFLYFMDFYFLGLLLFGKMGRYLYGR